MARNELARPLVNDDVTASAARCARWPLFGCVAAVASAACIAVFCAIPSHAGVGVVFPEPSSLEHANELLQTLPATMDQAELYKVDISPHLAIMYTQFLEYFGSRAQRLQGGSAVAAAEVPSAGGTDFKRRLAFFGESVKHIIQLNAESSGQAGHMRFALTEFADWSPEEFQSILGFTYKMPKKPQAPPATFKFTAKSPIKLADNKTCFDTEDNCGYWKSQGMCAESSALHAYMRMNCKATCEKDECATWKKQGFCSSSSKYSRYVNRVCPCHCGDVKADTKSINWVEKYPDVFDVRQQGLCGSCWAHSSVEMLRQMDGIKHLGNSLGLLSVQYLVDCVFPNRTCHHGVQGCCGGVTPDALDWIAAHGGVPLQASYGPYLSYDKPKTWHPCRHVPSVVTTSGARMMGSEAEMARVIVSEGVLALGVHANKAWQHYGGGILLPRACRGPLNHGVQCVGYDNSAKAWIVMNSWGKQWGVSATKPYSHIPNRSGFILLQYGNNTCNMATYASIAENVRRLDGLSEKFAKEPAEDVPLRPPRGGGSGVGGSEQPKILV